MSIARLFPEASKVPEVLERLENLSVSFSQSGDDFFAKWEAFAIKQEEDVTVTDNGSLDAFQAYLEKGARSTSQSKKPRLMPRQLHGDSLTAKFRHDVKPEIFTESMGPSVHVVNQFNAGVSTGLESRVSAPAGFNLNTDITQFAKERPFNAQLRTISTELDNEIERVLESIASAHNLSRGDFVNPHQISQNVGWAVGRIVREPAQLKTIEEAKQHWQANAKLDAKSMLLECSRRIGGGSRTSLDLGLISSEFLDKLFEGQIIAVKGTNPKGEQFIVHEIVELPKLPVAHVASTKRGDGPVRIAVAAAPSTVQDLEALTTWVYKSSRQSVSVLIIIGPLLDITSLPPNHPVSEEKSNIKELLKKLSRTVQIPIILVPSPDDAFTVDPLFPQPPFPDSELPVDQPLIRVSNPCTFSVDEVAVAVAANSSIKDMHLSNNKLGFQQILRQRRFYPVYPPPPGANVDIPQLKLANIGSVAPNVVIMPSMDDSMDCGIVDDVVYIAAGKLSNGFAVLTVGGGDKPLNSRIAIDALRLD